MQSTIRHFIFDMGNVLVSFDHELAVRNIAALIGADPLQVKDALFTSGLEHRYEAGSATTKDVFEHLQKFSTQPFSVEALMHAASDIFKPVTGMESLVREMKDRYGPVGLLSNTNVAHWNFIRERYPIVEEFSYKTLSYEVKAMKPDAKIYQHALQLCGFAPEQTLFIDDVPANCHGAEACGMKSHLFTSAEGLRVVLTQAGIL